MIRQMAGDALFMRGTELLQSGTTAQALWYLRLAARLAKSNPVYFGAAALAAYRSGDIDGGVRYAERALELDPGLDSARDLLGAMFLHGETYLQVLDRIHACLKPRTYLEIGVETGRSLALVRPQTRAIGIDPSPQLGSEPPPNIRVFRVTSDDFFARHDVRAELGGLPIDLAFIDGLHHFEFALRDFMNVERCSSPQSTIILDDCFPRDRRTAERERTTLFWTGDVWKVVVLLKKVRPELAIHTIAAPPSGVCIIRNLDPASRTLEKNYDRLRDEFMALGYTYLEKERGKRLNLAPNDWARIEPLLAS
jgi:tetratricopeptide (TPR) repeat protein